MSTGYDDYRPCPHVGWLRREFGIIPLAYFKSFWRTMFNWNERMCDYVNDRDQILFIGTCRHDIKKITIVRTYYGEFRDV